MCHSLSPPRADRKSQVRQCLGFFFSWFIGQRGLQISCTKTQTLPNLRLPISLFLPSSKFRISRAQQVTTPGRRHSRPTCLHAWERTNESERARACVRFPLIFPEPAPARLETPVGLKCAKICVTSTLLSVLSLNIKIKTELCPLYIALSPFRSSGRDRTDRVQQAAAPVQAGPAPRRASGVRRGESVWKILPPSKAVSSAW